MFQGQMKESMCKEATLKLCWPKRYFIDLVRISFVIGVQYLMRCDEIDCPFRFASCTAEFFRHLRLK